MFANFDRKAEISEGVGVTISFERRAGGRGNYLI